MIRSKTVPWLLLGLATAAHALAIAATLVTPPVVGRLEPSDALFGAAFFPFGVVGAVLAVTRRHPVGWLFLLAALANAFGYASRALGLVFLVHVPELGTIGLVLAWASLLASPLSVALVFWLPLLFPDGKLPSPRWRAPATIAAVTVAVVVMLTALEPGPMYTAADRPNPFGIAELAGVADTAYVAVVLSLTVPLSAVVMRFRRASGVERQQLKWVAFSSAVLLFLFGPIAIFGIYSLSLVLPFALAALPLSVGVAILRYRLYDIDVVIRRTLVYGAVVAILGAVYVVLVLLLQASLSQVTGGGPLPVAVSTLVIAALFDPVRGRVRDAVDRRFYRSRYDGQRTIESFARQLRDEMDLETVGATLRATAASAVRPTAAGVWLRGRLTPSVAFGTSTSSDPASRQRL